MSKNAFIVSFMLFLGTTCLYSTLEFENPEKIYVIVKKDNSVWNSGLIKTARSIASFGLSVVGFINILDLSLAPFFWNNSLTRYSSLSEYMISNGFKTFVVLLAADLLAVKNKEKIIIKEHEYIDNDNLIIVKNRY